MADFFCLRFPNKKQPSDHKAFPGKMDHTTSIVRARRFLLFFAFDCYSDFTLVFSVSLALSLIRSVSESAARTRRRPHLCLPWYDNYRSFTSLLLVITLYGIHVTSAYSSLAALRCIACFQIVPLAKPSPRCHIRNLARGC
jgi:hypothetical protein